MATARWLTLTAKKAGKCSECEQPVEVGQQIRWHPRYGAIHMTCAFPEMAENGGLRTMQSKFTSTCKFCGSKIAVGNLIAQAPNEKWGHVDCVKRAISGDMSSPEELAQLRQEQSDRELAAGVQ